MKSFSQRKVLGMHLSHNLSLSAKIYILIISLILHIPNVSTGIFVSYLNFLIIVSTKISFTQVDTTS
jgi:hypothetical protein